MRIKAKPLITRLNKGVLWVNLRFTAFWLTKTFDYQDCDFYDIDDTFLRSRHIYFGEAFWWYRRLFWPHFLWSGLFLWPDAFSIELFYLFFVITLYQFHRSGTFNFLLPIVLYQRSRFFYLSGPLFFIFVGHFQRLR